MKTIKKLIKSYLKNAKQRRDWIEIQTVMDRSPSKSLNASKQKMKI